MKLALVGATGLVGNKILEILEERKLPISSLLLVASKRSEGKTLKFNDQLYTVMRIDEALREAPQVALFSAGSALSLAFAERFAALGTVIVDNSSAWRSDVTKKLIVPEVNAHVLTQKDRIIANPNCSTIQMLVALHKLHQRYKIKRIVVSTYQAVSGAGANALKQLMAERQSIACECNAFPYMIDANVIPQIDQFLSNDYTKEEMKLVNETKKIMDDNTIKITATAVRVPVLYGHSESVNVEFEHAIHIEDVHHVLRHTPGVMLMEKDADNNNLYPMPKYVEGSDSVFVGRVRLDTTQANTVNMWIVGDNLRKGAATNAVQIVEYLLENNLLQKS